MGRLDNKIAIITGAAKGLGEANSRLFVDEGATVIMTDVDVENGERVAKEIGHKATFYKQDVRDEDGWVSLIEKVMADHGKLDILVNNAGVVEAGTIETQSAEEYRFVMAVSVDGTFFGCKHAIPAMKKTGGSIINMASIASVQGAPNVIAYCAAKGAVESLSRGIAAHCANHKLGIRCNSIHPAAILTPMVKSMPAKIQKAKIGSENPSMAKSMKLGEPSDVSNTVLFLASDESKFISGTRIVIDNGLSTVAGHIEE